MKFVDLSQHLHELRYKRSGRTIGAAMSVVEVWNGAIDCHLNRHSPSGMLADVKIA